MRSRLQNAGLVNGEWGLSQCLLFSCVLVCSLLYSGKGDKAVCPSSCYCVITTKIRSVGTHWELKVTNWGFTSLLCSSPRMWLGDTGASTTPHSPTPQGSAGYLTTLEVALPVSPQSAVPQGARHLKWIGYHFMGGRNPASSQWEIYSWRDVLVNILGDGGWGLTEAHSLSLCFLIQASI